MKHIDEQIRKVFSEKLSNVEAEVSPHMWEALQSKLSVNAANTAAVSGASKVIGFKMIAAVSAIIVGIATTVFFISTKKEETKKDVKTPLEQGAVHANQPTADKQNEVELEVPLVSEEIKSSSFENGQKKPQEQILVESAESSTSEYSRQDEANRVNQPIQEKNVVEKDRNNFIEKGDSHQASTAKSEEQKLSGNFQIIPADLDEMRYSFLAIDIDAAYEWHFGDEGHSNEKSPVHQYENEGEYVVTLTATSKNGESKSTTHDLTVYKPGKLIVPNIFTPNGDGSNDYFDPSIKSEGISFTKIIVSNSQGKVVFESNELRLWDGNDPSGNACSGGTYQYYISCVDRNHEVLENKGTVVLIR